MQTPLKTYLSILFLAVAVIFSACKGEDGDPGPAGEQGEQGEQGPQGAKGDNGEGFDDALVNGGFVVYLDGTRPDGIAFKDTLNFRFSPSALYYSSVYRDNAPADDNNEYFLKRYLGYNGSDYSEDNENSSGYLWTEFWTEGEPAHPGKYFSLYIDADISFPTDRKYFEMNDEFYFETDWWFDGETWNEAQYGNVTDSTFTDFSYTNTTGKFKYKMTYTVPADNNSTGYDLKVAVVTDATVYESLEALSPEVLNRKRTSDSKTGRAILAPKKVAKAEMKDLQ